MWKTISTAGVACASAVVLCGLGWAHGGTYNGPRDTVPPGGGGGGGGGGGPVGPVGPGGPDGVSPQPPGGDGPAGEWTGGDPRNPGPVDGTVTGAGHGITGPDYSLWSYWWDFNKDPFLNLKDRLHSVGTETGGPDFNLGMGERIPSRDIYRPSPRQIRDEAVPALLAALESETNNDIVTGCLVALAKIGDARKESGQSEFQAIIAGFLDDSNQEIRETAALALGILGHDDSAEVLEGLLLDTDVGRRAAGKASVATRTRAFAAYGLGMVGERTGDEALRRRIVEVLARASDEGSSMQDVGVACVLAMGLVPLDGIGTLDGGPTSGRAGQVGWLLECFRDERADLLARSHAPRSAVRLLDRSDHALRESLAAELVALLSKRTRDEEVLRQSAVLALGGLGNCDEGGVDADVRDVLVRTIDKAPDAQTKAFARLALGQVGARPGDGDPTAGRKQVQKELFRSLGRGTGSARRWSAMGLAVMGHAMSEQGNPSQDVLRALRDAFEEAKSPEDVGALAIAVGLVGDLDSQAVFLSKLKRSRVDEARGMVALGLGLLGELRSAEPIAEVVRESQYRPELLKQAAIALGLLGDKTIVPDLLEMLKNARSLASQASIVSALGFIGDARSIAPLIEMLGDRTLTETARGFAAVALGVVADSTPLPWKTSFSVDVNYRAAPDTLNANSAGTGLLNIL